MVLQVFAGQHGPDGFGACPAGTSYPAETGVQMHPLPKNLATMPNPCVGVPDSAWCKGGKVVA